MSILEQIGWLLGIAFAYWAGYGAGKRREKEDAEWMAKRNWR